MLQPTEFDVVLGKGRSLKEAGNEDYRALIAKNRVSVVSMTARRWRRRRSLILCRTRGISPATTNLKVLYSRNPDADKRKVVIVSLRVSRTACMRFYLTTFLLAKGVISAIQLGGGRFLNKDKQTGSYHLQSDEEISKSVSNVIRGGAPGIRKAIYAFERKTGAPPQTKEYDERCYVEFSMYTLAGIRGNPMEKAMLSTGARELLNLSVLEEVIECDEFDVALLLGKLDPGESLELNHRHRPSSLPRQSADSNATEIAGNTAPPTRQVSAESSTDSLLRQSTDATEIAGNTAPPVRQVSTESSAGSRRSSRRRRSSLQASLTSIASDEDKDLFEASNMDLFTMFTQRGSQRSLKTGLTDLSDDDMSTFSRITKRESQRSIMTGLSGQSDMSPQDDMSLVTRRSRLTKRGSVRSIRTGMSSLSTTGRSGDLSLQMEDMNLHPRHFVTGSNRSIGSGFSGISMRSIFSHASVRSSISAIDVSERSIP